MTQKTNNDLQNTTQKTKDWATRTILKTNNDLQKTIQKTKDRTTQAPLKTGINSRARVSSSCSTSGTRRFNLDWFYSEKNFKIPKGWSVTAKDNTMAKWKRQTTQWPNEKDRQHNGQMKKRDSTMAKWKRETTQWPNEKDRQHDGQMKKDKRTQNDRATQTPLKLRMKSCVP